MKNYLSLLGLGLAATAVHAQQPAVQTAPVPTGYQALLAATTTELLAARTVTVTKTAIGKLERASAAAPTDWLPVYYQGMGYVQISFLDKDEAARDNYLDQAQRLIDKGLKLTSNRSEVLVLQAYLYQARLSVSPMMRAMEYGPKISATLQEAQRADPQNPRASFLMGSNLLHKPTMFGGGSDAAKPWIEKAVAQYAAEHPVSPATPHWGREDATKMLAQINHPN